MPAGGEAAARGFYAELLGMIEVPKPAALAGRGGCWFHGGSAQVHLRVEADFRPAAKAHPALLVEDLTALAERLAVAGVKLTADVPLPGYVRGFVADPFGNRVELMERVAG